MNDIHSIAKELIREYREDVNNQLALLHSEIALNAWTPERAEKLAEDVLRRAVPLIEKSLLIKLKVNVGEATLTVMKRALQLIGVFVIAISMYVSNHKWPWS